MTARVYVYEARDKYKKININVKMKQVKYSKNIRKNNVFCRRIFMDCNSI
jgi:hypothetical protein